MISNRITAKLFVEDPAVVDLSAVIPVFHRWIARPPVEGLLIDVADYKHVQRGPGVVLVGLEGDYALDLRDGRPGVQYTRKRGWQDRTSIGEPDLRARLRLVLQSLKQARDALSREVFPGGRLSFRRDEVEFLFSDQLRAPNSPEAFAAIREDLTTALAEEYPGCAIAVEQVAAHPLAPLTVRGLLA